MLNKDYIENLTNEYLSDSNIFLTSIKILKNNKITVTIDSDNGVTIDDCAKISKYIESKLDRNTEDFELTVMSFGLGDFFSLKRQYKKNIGQHIEVILNDDTKKQGLLHNFENDKITLTNKKQNEETINWSDIKKSRVLINF